MARAADGRWMRRMRGRWVSTLALAAGVVGVVCLVVGWTTEFGLISDVGAGLVAILLLTSAVRRSRGVPRLADGTWPLGEGYDVRAVLSWVPGSRRHTLVIDRRGLRFEPEGGLARWFGPLLRFLTVGIIEPVPDDPSHVAAMSDVVAIRDGGSELVLEFQSRRWARVVLLHEFDRERLAWELVTRFPEAVESALAPAR